MVNELLKTGAENATPGRELCERLNLAQRELTEAVAKERRAGYPICAASGATPGYYLAADKEEMQTYCKSLNRRAGEIQKTRRACLKSAERLPERRTDQEGGDNGGK